MDRYLKPDRLEVDPTSSDAAKTWTHWNATFTNFLRILKVEDADKLPTLFNFVSPDIYETIADSATYDEAIDLLKKLYIKPKNEIFSRHLLSTCKQDDLSLDQFLQKLKHLAKDCNFVAVTAEKHRDEQIRDAFISGLRSPLIRQRLLEHKTLDLQTAFDHARGLDMAEQQNNSYQTGPASFTAAAPKESVEDFHSNESLEGTVAATPATSRGKCYFCGYDRHPRFKCPASNSVCKGCGKKGHFEKVCLSKSSKKSVASILESPIYTTFTAAAPNSLSKAVINLTIGRHNIKALVDTGSSESYITPDLAKTLKVQKYKSCSKITMASTNHQSETKGHCFINFTYNHSEYKDIKLSILPGLCADILLGHDFLGQHTSMEISFKGPLPTFSVCGVSAARVEAPTLFSSLKPECSPIKTKSRRYSKQDSEFINSEIQKLLKEGVVEPSNSSWCAKVLIAANERHKKD